MLRASVVVSPEIIFFLVAGMVLPFGFRIRIMLLTHWWLM